MATQVKLKQIKSTNTPVAGQVLSAADQNSGTWINQSSTPSSDSTLYGGIFDPTTASIGLFTKASGL